MLRFNQYENREIADFQNKEIKQIKHKIPECPMWISRQAARIMGNHNKVPSSETEFKESVLRLNFIRGSNIVGPT